VNMQDPKTAFIEAAATKEQHGVLEHRGGDASLPFSGNIYDEYEDEQLDSFNYLVRMHTTKIISDEEFKKAFELHLDCWFWMNRNVRRR
jgi:hypothetical protein